MKALKARFNRLARSGIAKGLGVGAALVASTSANAAVDVATVVSEIGAAATPIASIGSAVLIVMVGIKVYKWIRRAM